MSASAPTLDPPTRSHSVPATIARVQPITTARSLGGPFDYLLDEQMREQVHPGSMLVVPFASRKLLAVVLETAHSSELQPERLLTPIRVLEPGLGEELLSLADWVAREYCSTLARALSLVLPPGATRRLGGRRGTRAATRMSEVGVARPTPPPLNDEQSRVLELLLAEMREPGARQVLLHGVTGSGKTEVYLRVAAQALREGRGAIVLVPEIALTPQIVARFRERFGETVAVLHSRMSTAQRYEQWLALREGRARVCVGPRSAVFAPVADLGLIVVDEEHDSSYKNEGDPGYDAREVAAERASRNGALLVMGTATPRPESVRRMRAVTLPRRADGRALPPVRVLDMRGQRGGLHPVTAAALAQVRDSAGKAIVLLNRRGWSNFLSCRSCGAVWSCPECDVALVLHRAQGRLACHHCGHHERAPSLCADCGSTSVARHGAGTERLAHDLAEVLDDGGEFPIFRLDADVLGSGPEAEPGAILARFQRARSGALIGTQMVAKGHDFPDVGLAVVLDADATLRFPDFRAEERTFALISQLAGRAGRGGDGKVLVQTIAPQARAIRWAARHDSAGFVAEELQRRDALGYPPFTHLIRVVCAAEQTPAALAAAQTLRATIERELAPGEETTLLGPAPLFRLRGRERQVLVVKARARRAAVAAVGDAVATVAADRTHAGTSFSVDVDPQ